MSGSECSPRSREKGVVMRRGELAHVLRAASRIVDEPMLIIGSQAIHGGIEESRLPELTMMSREVDVAFWNDESNAKSDLIDGALGEMSNFDETFGYYAQGVSISTAILPAGWEGRLERFDHPAAGGAEALCLERHDLALSKLAAMREKDRAFVIALVAERLLDIDVMLERLPTVAVVPLIRARIARLLETLR